MTQEQLLTTIVATEQKISELEEERAALLYQLNPQTPQEVAAIITALHLPKEIYSSHSSESTNNIVSNDYVHIRVNWNYGYTDIVGLSDEDFITMCEALNIKVSKS